MADRIIHHVTEEDWPRLKPLWQSLYEHQRAHGMLLELPPDAFERWRDSLRPLLGRFAFILVAEREGALLGFIAGRVRSQPPYFGGQPAGFLSELFVEEARRRQGIADALLAGAAEWFGGRDITRLELQVLVGNPDARAFYRRRGWKEELVQVVREASDE